MARRRSSVFDSKTIFENFEILTPGRESSLSESRISNHVHFQEPPGKHQQRKEKALTIYSIISANNLDGLEFFLQSNPKSAINKRDRSLRTPLGLAVSLDRTEMVNVMIDAGADVNLCDKCGNSPLHEAVEKGNLEMVRILLNTEKCDLEVKDAHGQSALTRAVYHDYEDVAEALLTAGANTESIISKGRTCIFISVIESSINCMELLMKNGCNIQARDNYGFSVLRMIFKTNSIVKPEAIKLLQKYGYNIEHDRAFLEDLVEKGRDANDKLYAEMLLGNKSIKAACDNPFSTQGWYHRRSSLNRRISVISEVSLSFVYGNQPSFSD